MPARPLSGRVLVADSDRSVGSRVKGALQARGFRCYWAQDLDEAHQVAELLAPPDAVIVNAVLAGDQRWSAVVASLRGASIRETAVIAYGVSPEEAAAAVKLAGSERPDAIVGRQGDDVRLVEAITRALQLLVASDVPAGGAPVLVESDEYAIPTVALESVVEEEASPAAATFDGVASLKGELADTSVPRLLWHLYAERANGELRVVLPEGDMSIFFVDGQPAAVVGGGPTNVLGRVMERAGLLTPEAHRSALSELAAGSCQERFGEVLMRHRATTSAALEKGLSLQVEAKLLQLFAATTGTFVFVEGQETDVWQKPASVTRLILKGLAQLPREEVVARLAPNRDRFPLADIDGLPEDFPVTARTTALLGMLQGAAPLGHVLDAVDDRVLPALVLGLEAMSCIRYGVKPSLPPPGEGEPPEEPARSEAFEHMSGRFLKIKGKNFYDALGISRRAAPEEVAEACAQALEGLGDPESLADSAARERARELRKLFETIRGTLCDPERRAAYDRTLGVDRPDADYRQGFRFEELLQKANELLSLEQWDAAREAYTKAQKASSTEDADVMAGLGYAMFRKAADDRLPVPIHALMMVKRAIELRPRFSQAALYAGEILKHQNVLDEAARHFRYGLRHDPDNPQLRRALKLLGPKGATLPQPMVLVASDVACDGCAVEMLGRLQSLHERALAQALEKVVGPLLIQQGKSFEDDGCLFESRGKRLGAFPLDGATLPAAARQQLLGFAVAFKKALNRHLAKVADESKVPLVPTVRVALVLGEAVLDTEGAEGRVQGPLLAQALMALGKDKSHFATDTSTLQTLLEATSEQIPERLAAVGLAAAVAPDTAGSPNPMLVVGHPKAAQRREVAPPAPGLDRALVAAVPKEMAADLGKMDGALTGVTEGMQAVFQRVMDSEEHPDQGGLWERVVGKGKRTVDAVRLRTRLFEPILQGSKVYMTTSDLGQWLKLLEGVGRTYTDALFQVGQQFRQKTQVLGPRKIEVGTKDLMSLEPRDLLAISEACRLLPVAFQSRRSYQDITFSELTAVASDRLRRTAMQSGLDPGPVTKEVISIYDASIDAPDDSFAPVTFFEFFAVLALIGMTDGMRAFEVDHLAETHRAGSAKYERALEEINENAARYRSLLRTGLRHYKRITPVLIARSPYAPPGARSALTSAFELPLYQHVDAV